MSDVFLSYASADRERADQLAGLLSSAGVSVWIDRSGIEAATSWSGEIVDAVSECTAFIVLLSPASVRSKNVNREVALAFEKDKPIVPLDLEPVELTRDLQYHLAGVQRSPMTNIDAIIRALARLGIKSTHAPTISIVKEEDERKSLMILPFEDLSPTGDNSWFADGIVSELINALSPIKALRLMDAQTTREYKSYKGHLTTYAHEMSIRYFVQGDVRKFGDQIKISARLLDIETSEHLWQETLRGEMDDIFTIQETVAKNVLVGLSIILTPDLEKELDKRPTERADAYELYLKGKDYFDRHTKGDNEWALALYEDAIAIDPKFAGAHVSIANVCLALHRDYTPNPELLERAERAISRVRELEGETTRYFWIQSLLALRRGDAPSALQLAQRSLDLDPQFASGYAALAWAYYALGNIAETVRARTEYVKLRESDLTGFFNLAIALNEEGDRQALHELANQAIPLYLRHIRLNPDDYNRRVQLASFYALVDRIDEAIATSDALAPISALDGHALYNLACVYVHVERPSQALQMLRRAVAIGYRNAAALQNDPDLAALRGTPEFQEIVGQMQSER